MNDPKSILDGVTEHDVVTVHNPLSSVFVAHVARSVIAPNQPVRQATGNSNADAFMQGLQAGITNGGHQSLAHVRQDIPLQPGQTLRMPGDIARVVVRQLVKEMMQRAKAKKMMADPNFFMEYERKVVLDHASMLSNLSLETVEERLKRQLDELNKQPEESEIKNDERAFPTESNSEDNTGAGKPAVGITGTVGTKAGTAK